MKPWFKHITLSRPLRAIRLRRSNTVDVDFASGAAELQASYERGRLDGERAVNEALLRQRAELREAVEGALKSLRQAVPQVIRESENMLVNLALSIAQKLVSEMPISVAVVEAAVRDALAQIEGTAHFTVRLHPADLELLQKADSPVLSPADDGREFRFLSSPEVTRGGCVVQTQFGTVDARRETKFDLLKTALAS